MVTGRDPDTVGRNAYAPEPGALRARRSAVLAKLGNGAMVLPAAVDACLRGLDPSPYRPNAEAFYLTGFTEPGVVVVLRGFAAECRFVVFVRPRDPTAERWMGRRLGPEAALEQLGADACYPLSELEERLGPLLAGADRVHFRLGSDAHADRLVRRTLEEARLRGARTGTGPRGVVDPGEILDELRLRKDPSEVEAIRAAADLSISGHRALARELRPGAGEWELQAVIEEVFRRSGGALPAYSSIIASGPNACVLHYVDNRRRIAPGDVVLVDAAAQVAGYCADITRSYPASGRFTPEQRVLYEVVDRARAAAVAAVRPGVSVAEVHEAARMILADGLAALGVSVASENGSDLRRYFPHQTSHWLGLETHDCGDYVVRGRSRTLEEGMVLTVEPGLYFPELEEGRAARFAGIGIRIEDDVLVTASGGRNLTAALPTEAREIEELVGARAA